MTWQVERVANEHLTLEVLPQIGASVLNLRAASGRPVLRHVNLDDVKTSSQCASFTLLPYSNRIRDARFTFEGREVELRPTTKDGLAQHGDVRNRPWQVTRVSERHLSCNFDSRHFNDMNWPWAFTARVEYILHGPHLDTSVTLTNVDSSEMPAGMGLHPYFTRLQDGVDPCLSFGAALAYDTDERQLPTGGAHPVHPDEDYRAPSRIGARQLDRAYTAWDGLARLDWGKRTLTLTADPVYSHLVVFTAPDGSLALEPVTHATDAFNLAARGVSGTDMRTLTPGQSLAGTARITLEGGW
ncbi:aldose 1-epimerase [Deinococcus metallilatus]|uniref:Aldose 1-epimerase n=1 Tax=Deinococcus metallilatus TaxID=1211322 RepID=A0AAJ5JZ57_9DEIO|nr:aldose 1-epimerase [Deinococcus metallilatus]MBB5296240.1 aldose 1-epimerase [Deinococcus metallilatus]QBY09714.1 aldose 1-epimerase [Deinococcus metallilatus]RXJ08912.1 aldose 1-epimerase [Deinococcus metallilatus]TLK23709.1 aldose 1-epimerase [Deinococcus metallilatus]GMA14105.1 aldose 1-epimerase [Deinococcus metallilatus]